MVSGISGFLELYSGFQAQDSVFNKQIFPGFQHPDYLTWGKVGLSSQQNSLFFGMSSHHCSSVNRGFSGF